MKPTNLDIQNFSIMIEDLVEELNLTRLEAIIHYCSETELEIEVAQTLISENLKGKIQEESEKLRLLKQTSKLYS